MKYIQSYIDGKTATIVLSNPKKRNALSTPLLDEFIIALNTHAQDDNVHVVVIRAECDKVWSAGHDVSELPQTGFDPLDYHGSLERLLRLISATPCPVICMVNGTVWGAACDLAITCDLVVGNECAAFAITPVKIAVPYNVTGIARFMRRLPVNIAKEMFFTGEPLDAQTAHNVGLMNHLVPADELESFTYDLANRIGEKSALSVAVIKQQFELLMEAETSLNPYVAERISSLRSIVYNSRDYREGLNAFLEKRSPSFDHRYHQVLRDAERGVVGHER
jgi:methylmalonyl-CoA decarboxylase